MMHPFHGIDQDQAQFVERLRSHIKEVFGIEDTSGIEMLRMIRHLAQISESLECQDSDEFDLSGARWRLLLRLLMEEHMGNKDGITPTSLSKTQRVSKNTISALLRGLEEQGLIQRNLDPLDYRIFRIQLTQAGRELVQELAPRRLQRMNRMINSLSKEEIHQLMGLLDKLHRSMVTDAKINQNGHGG